MVIKVMSVTPVLLRQASGLSGASGVNEERASSLFPALSWAWSCPVPKAAGDKCVLYKGHPCRASAAHTQSWR